MISIIILNEREFAITILDSKNLGKKPSEAVGRIMRMWYADGKPKKQIKSDIIEFLSKYAPDLSLPRWETAIDRQIKLLDKYPLIEVGCVGITKKEIDTVSNSGGRMHRRLAFTLLGIAKFKNAINEKNNDWVSCSDKEIFKMANIQKDIIVQSSLFKDLRDAGLIQFSRIVDNLNVRVLFIDKDGDVSYSIDDFRNLGNQIHMIEGEPYIKCQECGLCIRQNKWNNKKYCPACAKYKPIEKKFLVCSDCGSEFEVDSKANNRSRCTTCAQDRRRKQWRDRKIPHINLKT